MFYATEQRFGYVIRTRLARIDKTLHNLAVHLGCSVENLMNVFKGEALAGSCFKFTELDRFFGTHPGYMEECFKNCSVAKPEYEGESVTVPPAEETEMKIHIPAGSVPEGMMLIPIDLIKDVLDDISRGHDFTENSLKLLELFKETKSKGNHNNEDQ